MEEKKPIENTKPLNDETLEEVSGGRNDGRKRADPEKDIPSPTKRRPGY